MSEVKPMVLWVYLRFGTFFADVIVASYSELETVHDSTCIPDGSCTSSGVLPIHPLG
jgi:hypothetical protein